MTSAKVKKVLIVDDEKIVRDFLAKFFDLQGIEAICAECGFDAITIAKSTHFDIIFLDVRMPKIDGVETLKELKKITGDTTKYVMMTGYSIDNLLTKLENEKIEAFIRKPFKIEELQAIFQGYAQQDYHEKITDILIIEKETALLNLFGELLEKYNLTIARTGQDALSQVSIKKFDLAISSLFLEDMSGLEVYAKIKAIKPDLNIILIMGDTKNSSHVKKECLLKQISDLL